MAAKLESPGIQTSYQKGNVSTIKGADLGVAIAIGVFEWGEVGKPITIYNPTDAKNKIGGYLPGYYGRKCIDVMFDEGIRTVIALRIAHRDAGILQAKKSGVTLKGLNPGEEDRTMVDTVNFTAACEGTYGDRINITTLKAKAETTAVLSAGIVSEATLDSLGLPIPFEVGDVTDISDGTHYVRVIITAISTANNKLFFAPVTLTDDIASGASVKTVSTHKILYNLAGDLTANATSVEVENVNGISIGQIITFFDIRETNPNSVTVKVTNISGNTLYFDDIGALTTILATNGSFVSQEFNITVKLNTTQSGNVNEYLSLSPEFSQNYIANKFKNSLLEAVDLSSSENFIGDIPEAVEDYYLNGGDDGLVGLNDADFIGSGADKTGLYALDSLPDMFAQIECFDSRSAVVKKSLVTYAENKLWWVETGVDFDKNPEELVYFKKNEAMLKTTTGAIQYPNAYWLNPQTNTMELLPISAWVIGLNSRIWNSVGKGPWTQPAGVENGVLNTVRGLESSYTQDVTWRNLISKNSMNSVYKDDNYGYIVYDINTLDSDHELAQKGETVTFMYSRHSIQNGVPWAVFMNIDDKMKGRVYRTIRKFLKGIWDAGGLKGLTEEEAFNIDLESENTPEREEAGEFYAKIGLSTKKGARMIYFIFSKKIGE